MDIEDTFRIVLFTVYLNVSIDKVTRSTHTWSSGRLIGDKFNIFIHLR